MDGQPAPIEMHAPAALRPTAAEVGPASPEAAELCRRASRFDWEYMGAMLLADVGTIVLDAEGFQSAAHAGVRLVGPGLVGLSWGWTVGGTYLTLPQCGSGLADARPPEGDVRSVTPLAISFAVLAAATAPLVVGVETGEGSGTLLWSPAERVMRLVIAGASGVVGSVMPYVLPPSTWRAFRKLQHVSAGIDPRGGRGGTLVYAFAF